MSLFSASFNVFTRKGSEALLAVIAIERFIGFLKKTHIFIIRRRDFGPLELEVATLADQNNKDQKSRSLENMNIYDFHISLAKGSADKLFHGYSRTSINDF